MSKLNIVLIEPEIPQNTGNIARTCAAVGAALHLVGPLGFTIDDRKLKRAGLDYWHLLDISHYTNSEEFFEKNRGAELFYLSTKAAKNYTQTVFSPGCFVVFGKETAGLPEKLLKDNAERALRIPMVDGARSLNLSNAVAVVAFEALRQWGFPGLFPAVAHE